MRHLVRGGSLRAGVDLSFREEANVTDAPCPLLLGAAQTLQDLLVLGSDGMNLYTCRISAPVYALYDEVPHQLVDSTDTCDGLLTRALMRSLE